MLALRPQPAFVLVVLGLLGALAALPAPSGAMTIRLAETTSRVTIPGSKAGSDYLGDKQRASTPCRPRERVLAPGIVDAPRHLIGQTFGPSVVGAWAAGIRGRATLRLQALCTSGSSLFHEWRAGKTRLQGSSLTTTARLSCGRGYVAIGAPLSREFSPGFGRFVSKPKSVSEWTVKVEGVPASYLFATTAPAYADVACVPRSSLKAVETIEGSTDGLAEARTAALRLPCRKGRRPLGWGVDLHPFTDDLDGRAKDGWGLPIVRKAAFSGRAMEFQFDLPPGGKTSVEDVTQTAYVVCAKLVQPPVV